MMTRIGMIIGVAAGALLVGCGKKSADHGSVTDALPSASGPIVERLVEAETLTELSGDFAVTPAPGAAGEQTLAVAAGLAKTRKVGGNAKVVVSVPADVRLNTWLRVYWTGTCSNSVIVKGPGLPPKIVGESATYNTWHWVQGPTVEAKAGELKLELQVREDGIFVDQVLVTSDPQRVPVGIEEATTPQVEQHGQVANDTGE